MNKIQLEITNINDYNKLANKFDINNKSNLFIEFPPNKQIELIFDEFLKNIEPVNKSYYSNTKTIEFIDILTDINLYIFFINCIEQIYLLFSSNKLDYPIYDEINYWYFCIYDNMMFNLPFTLQNIIFIPIQFLNSCFNTNNKRQFINTIIHEKLHVFQRNNHLKWTRYINMFDKNWIKITKKSPIYNLISNTNLHQIINYPIIVNPDTYYDFKYIYKLNDKLYYGVLILINNILKTQWFLIDPNTNTITKSDLFILEHEHPYEIYAYELANKLYPI